MTRIYRYAALAAMVATLALPTVAAPAVASASPGVGPGVTLPYPIRIVRTGGSTVRLNQIINIATDGRWWYSERRRGVFISGTLSPWQRVALRRLELDPALPGALGSHPQPFGCADAFRYEVTLAWWLPVSTFTDCDSPPTPLARLVHAVMGMTAF